MPTLSGLIFLGLAASTLRAAEPVRFNEDVRPILFAKCVSCHGPDEGDRQAGLRLDTFEGATEDFGGYSAVAPGDADASELIARVTSDDEFSVMPPPEHGQPLSAEEVATLRRWIDEGAEYERHWSFTPPTRPDVPQGPHADWGVNAVDRFVAAGMAPFGPAPRERPERLLRRVALGLTGLPPVAFTEDAERAAFEAYLAAPSDATYEAVVDVLLASPAYGEHQAAKWLDLARYADTVGYAGDETRTIWPWRDWVIRAFNENMPYDEFTRLQVAGDLRTDATPEQILATAFHRNTLSNNEGGTNDEEFRTIAVKDRLSTTVNTWMAITVRCAECHSHKYDPVSHSEYYALLDFFNQTADSDKRNEHPVLQWPVEGAEKPLAVPVLGALPAEKRRTTQVNLRGNYRSLGEAVSAAVPAAFNPLPEDAARDRAGFADWLLAEDNPLTARVAVNRMWARLFGRGLVVTEEDFGTQGSPPTHPELLDWLAVEFREGGWDRKALQKTIVMSATYRQSAAVSEEAAALDPANERLARGPRFRLPAEVVRDQSLAAAGLLSRKMYGPPVYPPSPIKKVKNAFKGDFVWKRSEGEDQYRRAVYTFLKRSLPHPLFETFDMSTRDVCSLRRFRTNTPLQSFMTLNDETFVEAAQELAKRTFDENGVGRSVASAYRRAVGDEPDAETAAALASLYADSLAEYRGDEAAAQAMAGLDDEALHAAELAAMTVVCNVILNLDAVLTN